MKWVEEGDEARAAGDLSSELSLLPNQGIRELKYIYLFTQLLCGEIMVQTQALGIHIPYFSHCASSFLIWDDVVLWNFQFFEFI